MINRRSQYLYKAGSTVFLMRPPGKKIALAMQSHATEVNKNLTFDQLKDLGSKLTLPPVWSFEARTLTKDRNIPMTARGRPRAVSVR
jgi:hypothetical protein